MNIDSPNADNPAVAKTDLASVPQATEAEQSMDADVAAQRAQELAAARRKASSNRVARYFLRSRRDRSSDDHASESPPPSKLTP